jgi:hypothetical protein
MITSTVSPGPSPGRLALSSCLAGALATSAVMHFGPEALRNTSSRWLAVAALALLWFWPLYRWGFGWFVRQLLSYSRWGQRAWILGSLAGAALLIVVTPLPPPGPPAVFRLEVTALGEKNAASQGTEVWVQGLYSQVSGRRLPLEPMRVSGEWEEKYGKLLSAGQPAATLRWEGSLDQEAVLKIVRHPYSGRVRVALDGEAQTVDLFSPSQDEWVLPVRVAARTDRLLLAIVRLSEWLSLGLVLLAGIGVALWPGPQAAVEPSRWGWLVPAGLCAAVWSLYLLSFWPGFMTVDSMDQWTQMVKGPLANHHPVYHTLTNWLLTRLWESPAAIALAQILAMATAFAFALRELSRWGVPRWMQGLLTALFALSPANGTLVITLWKDIAYAIMFVVLFTLLLQVARTRGETLRSTRFLVSLGAVLTYTALVRHNGPLVVLALLGVLIFISPRQLRRRAGLVALGVVSTFVLMTGPLQRVIGAQPMHGFFPQMIQIHQLGAMARAAPDSFRPEDRQLLEAIQPWDVWRNAYYCYSINPLVYNPHMSGAFFDTPRKKEFIALWLRQLTSHWRVLAEHQACVSSLVWRIRPPTDGYLYAFSFDMEPNELGLVQEPKLPALREALVHPLKRSVEPEPVWWVWRPAPYLYLTLFVALIAAARLRSPWVLLPILPVLLNSVVLLGLNLAQDFRYQYPVYVVALLSPALLFVRRSTRAEAVAVPPLPSVDQRAGGRA